MIGQFGSFDFYKFEKDYREGFYGIEACLMKSDEDISMLLSEVKKKGLTLGIHFPLRSGLFSSRDPLFLDLDPDIRRQAYNDIENELIFINSKEINPHYILFHYPKPVIINETFDLSRWRFYNRSEFVYENDYTFNKLIEYSEFLFDWLSERADKYNFIPVLELDALNRYITETSYLDDLLATYNKIKLCIDVGRLHVQDSIDPGFHAVNILQRFLKYTEVIHLWHAKVGKTVEYGHFPLLPGLIPEDGWADVQAYFKIIRQENKNIKLLFEHRSDLVTKEELELCYNWVDELMNKS